MFKFENKQEGKGGEPVSPVNESVDYASYLLEVQQSRAALFEELSKPNILSNVEKKVIDVNSFKSEETKKAVNPVISAQKVDKEFEKVKQGNGY